MLGSIARYVPSPAYFMPILFRQTAEAVEFTADIFKSKPTHSGTLTRLTYGQIKNMDSQYPGFIDRLMAAEVVAPYPKHPDLGIQMELVDRELQKRFGATNPDRCVFAILDDKGHPHKTPNEPLSIIYGAFGHDGLADSLKEILDGSYGRRGGKLPQAITFYSAINLAFNDADAIRKSLSRGIGGRQVEETRFWLKEQCPWLKTAGTLSPVLGYEDWLQKTTDAAELKGLEEALAAASNPITLEALRAARTERGAVLSTPEVIEATERSIAYFVLRTKAGRDGNPSPMDNAFGLHVGNGAIPTKVLLADPEDPRMRYVYPMDDSALSGAKQDFVSQGIIRVSAGFRTLISDGLAVAKKTHAVVEEQPVVELSSGQLSSGWLLRVTGVRRLASMLNL